MGIPLHSCSLHSSAAATLVASSSDLSQRSKWLRSYKRPISNSRRSSNSRCEAAAARCLASTGYGREQEQQDAAYMRECVELARQAIGHTSPNPMVGCVLVKEGKVVGRGFHPKAGQPHAEVFALRDAGELAENATAYVSLEPCNHFGRTPPCSAALVRSRVKRVVVGMIDPNPKVAGEQSYLLLLFAIFSFLHFVSVVWLALIFFF
jgi:diaminohydroxyphosphoribosylaminopyrimidine deaminase/5-amino-6-(5-phosphoribosylamino)uracil reductase